jgi:PAS domain S-box-containing protein
LTFARFQVRSAERRLVDVAANVDLMEDEEFGRCARIVKFPMTETLRQIDGLRRENELLSSIVSTARDATYCVEFIEPVDLTAPEHEIIRQVFENRCIWRYCNEAMSHLYKLPVGDDLNRHDVREVFARNPDNEIFVRTLNQSRWNIDGALSRDHRYDGADVYIENDVRADIRDGQLYRFWGVVRELSARRMHERDLEDKASTALDILAAVADPMLVADGAAQIIGVNPAVEWALGWPADQVLGRNLAELLHSRADWCDLIAAAKPARLATCVEGVASRRDGGSIACSVVISTLPPGGQEPRCVLTLRLGPAGIGMERAS